VVEHNPLYTPRELRHQFEDHGAKFAIVWDKLADTVAEFPSDLALQHVVSVDITAALPVALVYCAFFTALALYFPDDPSSAEEIAFQLTMPGLEEEPFYRGILLFALARAFTRRVRFLGVDWGWGALLSCGLFSLAHAFGYSGGHFSFDPVVMALTAIPSLLAAWLRLRTGSLLLPILLHNFGNAISLML
jgi:membrane protease YdiL (CAAX protease family)